jgi:hypothetical protein
MRHFFNPAMNHFRYQERQPSESQPGFLARIFDQYHRYRLEQTFQFGFPYEARANNDIAKVETDEFDDGFTLKIDHTDDRIEADVATVIRIIFDDYSLIGGIIASKTVDAHDHRIHSTADYHHRLPMESNTLSAKGVRGELRVAFDALALRTGQSPYYEIPNPAEEF